MSHKKIKTKARENTHKTELVESSKSVTVGSAEVGVVMEVTVEKKQQHFKRIRNVDGPDVGVGEFFLLVGITALTDTVHIPLSIASSKKVTGFMYQLEGTKKATLVSTDLSVKGEGVTQVTLGTIHYVKIPRGKKALFRILIIMKGQVHNTYKATITRINYKLKPIDVRYKQFQSELESGRLVIE
jgi:hypothetical protein